MNAFSLKRFWLPLVLFPLLAPVAFGGLPEPDNLVFGTIALGTKPVTAADTGIAVEARRSLTSPAIARYQMGSNPSAGDYYSLRISVESLPPVTDPTACETGTLLYLVVTDSTGVRDQKTFTVGERGQVTRLDFGWIDTDHNGLSDEWERKYFGRLGIDPNADPDRDGRNNLKESQDGTHPLVADTPHPADRNPRDYAIDIDELTAYALAWKTGQAWPDEPTSIPLDYVTRAGYLWKNGEHYWQDLTMDSTPPLWWTNLNSTGPLKETDSTYAPSPIKLSAASLSSAAPSQVICSMPPVFKPGEPILVKLAMHPRPGVAAYGLEAQVPADWGIVTISDGGRYEASSQMIKWGLFFDDAGTVASCELLPGASTADEVGFMGAGSFDGVSVPVAGRQSLLRAGVIKFQAVSGSETSGCQVRLRSEPDKEYIIEISLDLSHWQVWDRLRTTAEGIVEFRDDSAGPTRFYRARAASP
jgi:hypothetical protein